MDQSHPSPSLLKTLNVTKMNNPQLEIDFTWKDLTPEEVEWCFANRWPKFKFVTDEHYIVVDLTDLKIACIGPLFRCIKFCKEAPPFYRVHPHYLLRSKEQTLDSCQHLQLIGCPY